MGNYITTQSSNITGKVILSDGRVQEFDQPVTVAELMLEHPQQVVVEFCPNLTEKRPTPLPADKKLEKKKLYLMLPIKRGKPASLSSAEARHVVSCATSLLRSRSFLSTSRILPLFARICPADGHKIVLERKESNNSNNVEKRYDESSELLPEILENRPEYLSKQFSGKGWKPSLDTIKEQKIERKIPHWLFNFQG